PAPKEKVSHFVREGSLAPDGVGVAVSNIGSGPGAAVIEAACRAVRICSRAHHRISVHPAVEENACRDSSVRGVRTDQISAPRQEVLKVIFLGDIINLIVVIRIAKRQRRKWALSIEKGYVPVVHGIDTPKHRIPNAW